MAISSIVNLWNLALNAVGSRDNISSSTENSREAEVCNLWYSPVRDQILAAAYWPDATEMANLSLLAEADDSWGVGDPRPGYSYVYALPSDLLRPRYLTDYSPFLITSYSDNRRAIHTSGAAPTLIYTKRLELVSLWDPELQMAMVYGLAAHICMPLTGKPSRAKMLVAQANDFIMKARESAANVSQEIPESIPDWITARGYSHSPSQRFYYPLGSLLSLSSV